jgi:two-component system sensor histidine kinase KdpD
MPTGSNTDNRPNPDALLEKINRSERGKLTVFLGAAAGVGKTYTMLEAAHDRLREGKNIVIGWVETHSRAETEQLVDGLPCIAPKTLEYRGKALPEMDIDTILARKPELVLVDELAHTNVPGSRHVRRFQDVEDLLKAGINVYTTLNIQHIESLNDVVAQITGVVVKETVPDHIVEQADNIQIIDIPPEELIKRLKEGKVYVPGQAERALKNFFRPGNISALRELALRFTAKRVDLDLAEYMREHKIEGPWPAAGRVMVCVSASPFSTQLIRAARRLATGLQSEWLAVHIETTGSLMVSDEARDRVARNMRLAEELGARTLSVSGNNTALELLEIARSNNATAIVIGKPRHSRLWELFHRSVVDTVIRQSGGINVYVIQAHREDQKASAINTATPKERINFFHYVASLAMVAAVTVFGWLYQSRIDIVNVALLYQLPVTLSAFWWGRWPSYFTAVCSVLLFDFLFIPPVFTFTVNDIRYIWSFATFLIIAFVIGGRTELLKGEAAAARLRESSTRALYKFSREIAAVIDLTAITRELAQQAADTLNRRVLVLLPGENEQLMIWADHSPGEEKLVNNYSPRNIDDAAEAAVATWVYQHREVAGRSSETLPSAKCLYLPLTTRENIVGVLGLHIVERLITPEQRRLMESWAGMAAIAIERVNLSEKAREAALLRESDRLRTALLNSISHELRTPLSSIIGSTSTLLEAEAVYSAEERRELLENIKEGANRMDRVVANLLDTARLESGMMRLKTDWCDIEDIIGAALRRLKDQLVDRVIEVGIDPEAPLLRADCVLVEQVVINLIDNALKYSPPQSPIAINVVHDEQTVKLMVADRGVGIPADDLLRVFDKFYRVQNQEIRAPGTGLGLSICKGIVEAHGGMIWAENRVGGGVIIGFSLPIAGE